MEVSQLEKKLSKLEKEHGSLIKELTYINGLMISIGFSEGIESVKRAANDIIKTDGRGKAE